MITCGGWRVAGEKEGKNLVRFKQPTLYSGKGKCLAFELVPCHLNKKIAWFAAKEGSTK